MQDAVLWAFDNTLAIIGFVLLVSIVVTWLMMKKEKREEPEAVSSFAFVETKKKAPKPAMKAEVRGVAKKWESEEHRALLVMCMGDVEKVERLIAFEKSKAPGEGRESWIKEAIARWGRDLHRL